MARGRGRWLRKVEGQPWLCTGILLPSAGSWLCRTPTPTPPLTAGEHGGPMDSVTGFGLLGSARSFPWGTAFFIWAPAETFVSTAPPAHESQPSGTHSAWSIDFVLKPSASLPLLMALPLGS